MTGAHGCSAGKKAIEITPVVADLQRHQFAVVGHHPGVVEPHELGNARPVDVDVEQADLFARRAASEIARLAATVRSSPRPLPDMTSSLLPIRTIVGPVPADPESPVPIRQLRPVSTSTPPSWHSSHCWAAGFRCW